MSGVSGDTQYGMQFLRFEAKSCWPGNIIMANSSAPLGREGKTGQEQHDGEIRDGGWVDRPFREFWLSLVRLGPNGPAHNWLARNSFRPPSRFAFPVVHSVLAAQSIAEKESRVPESSSGRGSTAKPLRRPDRLDGHGPEDPSVHRRLSSTVDDVTGSVLHRDHRHNTMTMPASASSNVTSPKNSHTSRSAPSRG